jgi:hypothetical protein
MLGHRLLSSKYDREVSGLAVLQESEAAPEHVYDVYMQSKTD